MRDSPYPAASKATFSRGSQPTRCAVAAARNRRIFPGNEEWGGWGSNPRPADYEKHGPELRVRYLHRYHEAVPPIALIAPLARVARSTNRSTLYHGDHRIPSQNVTAAPADQRARD